MIDYIDTHAHLQLHDYDEDREQVIKEALERLKFIINIGIDLPSSMESIELSKQYPGRIYSTVGIHPNNTGESKSDELNLLKKMILENHKYVKAIGEIGLDFYRQYSSQETQKKWFIRQLELALELKMPAVIHSRQAFQETIEILTSVLPKKYPVLFHCFSEGLKEMEQIIKEEYMIAVGGALTYKNSVLPNIIPHIPDHLLTVETDCPFLSPHPWRGKRNVPERVINIVEKIAELKRISIKEASGMIFFNGARFFRLLDDDQLVYELGQNLYINLTNRCTNHCYFCPNTRRDFHIACYDLKLSKEPSAKDIISLIDEKKNFEEAVFCGFGEPTLRLEVLKEVAVWLKEQKFKTRLNTNGHGNMIYKRNILKELAGLIDIISVSLNGENSLIYEKICRPAIGNGVYEGVVKFASEANKMGFETYFSVVTVPEIDIEKCRQIASNLKIPLKIRQYQKEGF